MRARIETTMAVVLSCIFLLLFVIALQQASNLKDTIEVYDEYFEYTAGTTRLGIQKGEVICARVTDEAQTLETMCHEYAHYLVKNNRQHYCGEPSS